VVVLDIHDDDDGSEKGAGEPGNVDLEERSGGAASTAIVGPYGRRGPSSASIKRWAVRIVVVALALAAIFFASRIYLDRQWYVGESGGRVAVYQGIPATLAGLRFSHVSMETDIPAEQVTRLPLYRNLANGITASDRGAALQIVDQIRSDLETASKGAGS
jgi:hypothetical protein